MPITTEHAAELQANASRYGCGLDTCHACYPVQYACEFCATEWPQPILNGEVYECPECSWVANGGGE